MTVHVDSRDNARPNPAAPEFDPRTEQAPRQEQYAQPEDLNWFDMESNLFEGEINSSLGSEIVIRAEEKFREQLPTVLDRAHNLYDVDIVKIDNSLALPFAILVFTLRHKTKPELGMSYHSVLVAATDEAQATTNVDIQGVNVEKLHTPDTRYGVREKQEVEAELRKIYPDVRRLIEVDAQILQREFDLTDTNQTLRFVSNAVMACRNLLVSRAEGWRDINFAQLGHNSGALIARTVFNRTGEQIVDEGGLPVRSDIRMTLQTPEILGQGGQVIQRAGTLARIAGFVDLVWSPPAQNQQGFGPYGRPSTQIYLPRLILTHLDMAKARSIGGQLLALLSALALYEQNTALSVLYPNTQAANTTDLNDISALNIEGNLEGKPGGGERFHDLAAGNVSDGDIMAYMQALIQPTFELALDVSDAGSDTWLNSVFLAAAQGNVTAANAIISAADELTNGHFGAMWKQGTSIAIAESRVPLGHYEGANGKVRDARDCAYLPVLNVYGEKDIRVVEEWSDAKTNPNQDESLSLFRQRRISQSVLGDITWTGVATRMVINPEFTMTLSRAFAAAGGDLQLNVPGARHMEQRSAYAAPNLNPHDMTGHLRRNTYGAQPGQRGGYQQGRWGNYR